MRSNYQTDETTNTYSGDTITMHGRGDEESAKSIISENGIKTTEEVTVQRNLSEESATHA